MFMVCGEALLDVFAAGSTASGMAFDGRIGGSPLNVAIGLARLGQAVGFVGGVSDGFVGDRLMQALRDEGIDPRAAVRLAAPATLSLVGVDAAGVPSYAFYGNGAADRRLLPEHLARIPAEARVFHFGSFAMVVQPTGATQRALIERERHRSLISYDPNVRLNVEPELDIWRDTIAWMALRTHLLKVSDEDIGHLYPGRTFESLARDWLDAGVALVVVTRGGLGTLAWGAGWSLELAAPAVTVVDTVGAGDTFQAAMLAALAERGLASADGVRSLSRDSAGPVLDFALRAAAITCSRRGADLPRRAELG